MRGAYKLRKISKCLKNLFYPVQLPWLSCCLAPISAHMRQSSTLQIVKKQKTSPMTPPKKTMMRLMQRMVEKSLVRI